MKRLLTIGILLALATYAFRQYRDHSGPPDAANASDPSPPVVQSAADRSPERSSSFSCDGRTHCSQMTSCAEATYFLEHCPGVKMDGEGDGVPCEKQWCGHH
jgi:hypothetical protein